MLAKIHRFHGHNALRHVYQHGQRVGGPLMAIKVAPNDRHHTFRAAVVVSKKVSKSAVKRNRIRRRLYQLLRAHQAAIRQPYDIVITVSQEEAATMPLEQLAAQLRTQLQRAGVLTKSAPAKE